MGWVWVGGSYRASLCGMIFTIQIDGNCTADGRRHVIIGRLTRVLRMQMVSLQFI